jgi:hypothetical protein
MKLWKVELINRATGQEGFLAEQKVKPLEGILETRLNDRTQQGWTVFSILSVAHEGNVYVIYNKEK